MGQTLFYIRKSLKSFWIKQVGGLRNCTHVSKLGSNTRHSNEHLIEKSFNEAPNSSSGPSLSDFTDSSISPEPAQKIKTEFDQLRHQQYLINDKHKISASWLLVNEVASTNY